MRHRALTVAALAVLTGLIVTPAGYAQERGQAIDKCPATKTLSDFRKASSYARNQQGAALVEMERQGDLLYVRQGTRGLIQEERTLDGLPIVRFAYPGNPNGDYGVWTFANCIRKG